MNALFSKKEADRAYVAIGAIFLAAPAVSLLGALSPIAASTQTLLSLTAISVAAAYLVIAFPSRRSRSLSLELVALIGFLLMAALACGIAQASGRRPGGPDMWLQAVMALAPLVAFVGGRAWSAARGLTRSLDGVVIAVGVLSGGSVLAELVGLTHFESYGSRYFGFMSDPAAWLLSFSCTYFFFRRRGAYTVFLFALLLLTQTRGPIAVFITAVALGSALVLRSDENAWLKIARTSAIVGAMIVAFMIVGGGAISRFSSVNVLSNDRTSTTAFTMRVYRTSPLFGSGYGAHSYFSGASNRAKGTNYGFWSTPTSTFAQILADFGTITFMFFLIFWFSIASTVFKMSRAHIRSELREGHLALGIWVVTFVVVNQTAIWIVAGSLLSPIVYICAGIVAGSRPAGAPALHRRGQRIAQRSRVAR